MAYQSPAKCINSKLSAYAYFYKIDDVGRSLVKTLYRRRAMTDSCGMPFLKFHNLLHISIPPVVSVKLCFVKAP